MSGLTIRLLGEIEVERSGAILALPQSKKTRALFAYLVATNRPHRRAQLSACLWEGIDDPRSGLRWSLSKLRQVLDADGARLVSDRESIRFDSAGVNVDLLELRRVTSDIGTQSTIALIAVAKTLRGELLEGVDLPDCPEFQAWCVAERADCHRLQIRLLDALVERLKDSPESALLYARRRVQLDRKDERAHAAVLRLLVESGYAAEAREHYIAHKRWLEGQGEKPGAILLQAYSEVNAALKDGLSSAAESKITLESEDKPVAQKIQFCTTSDGVRIAYSTSGSGPPLVKTANWLNHLEFDWQSEVWRDWLKELSRDHCLIRYDERGNGLSDWEVSDLSLGAFVEDMETVIDALSLKRYPVLGISQGAAVAVAHAARHPERVSHLILINGFAQGWRLSGPPIDIERVEALVALARTGWGQSHPAFRQVFTSLFFPEASSERMQAFNELQRRSTSPVNAVRLLEAFGTLDATEYLAKVRAPTLVLHSRQDGMVPFSEGMKLAKSIPGARFVPLEGRNHLILENEPGWPRLWDEIRSFLGVPRP